MVGTMKPLCLRIYLSNFHTGEVASLAQFHEFGQIHQSGVTTTMIKAHSGIIDHSLPPPAKKNAPVLYLQSETLQPHP